MFVVWASNCLEMIDIALTRCALNVIKLEVCPLLEIAPVSVIALGLDGNCQRGHEMLLVKSLSTVAPLATTCETGIKALARPGNRLAWITEPPFVGTPAVTSRCLRAPSPRKKSCQ